MSCNAECLPEGAVTGEAVRCPPVLFWWSICFARPLLQVSKLFALQSSDLPEYAVY